jgi:hypothetical protein
MKKISYLFIVSSIIISLVSCKTTNKVNCDAYGYIEKENVEFDIEKINQDRTSKYVTTFTIK